MKLIILTRQELISLAQETADAKNGIILFNAFYEVGAVMKGMEMYMENTEELRKNALRDPRVAQNMLRAMRESRVARSTTT